VVDRLNAHMSDVLNAVKWRTDSHTHARIVHGQTRCPLLEILVEDPLAMLCAPPTRISFSLSWEASQAGLPKVFQTYTTTGKSKAYMVIAK
jgi:hypothetical protein